MSEKPMVDTLYFSSDYGASKDGVQVTVRRGLKWAGHKHGYVNLCMVGSASTSPGVINGTRIFRCKDIPEKILLWEHDKVCRKMAGLVRILGECYDGFDENEIVTVVYYSVMG